MADSRIGQLPAAASLLAGDLLEIESAIVSKYVTGQQIKLYVMAVSKVAGDVASTDAVNWADITGLTFSVVSGETYAFEAVLFLTSAVTTTAPQISVNGPAAPTLLEYSISQATSATAKHDSVQTAYDTVTNAATGPGATVLPCYVRGIITPSASGTFAFRLRSEVAASAVTVKANSYARVGHA